MVLLLSPAALKALMGMPKRERAQLKARLDAIAAAPGDQHASVTALQGEPRGRFRVRQGDYPGSPSGCAHSAMGAGLRIAR